MENKRYNVQCRQTGDVFADFDSVEEAWKHIEENEKEDKENGTYTEDFYEVYDNVKEEIIF